MGIGLITMLYLNYIRKYINADAYYDRNMIIAFETCIFTMFENKYAAYRILSA